MEEYYNYVQQAGKLRTHQHAVRWSDAVLKTLGLNLDRKTKKQLTKALPAELASALNGVFWLAFFRDTTLPSMDFQKMVARRSGNTDAQFARYPVLAVFNMLKTKYADANLGQQIADTLSPELRELWEVA